ncbi:hypothetical protein [Falsibacillus pallidus]|uniref:DUF2157 domain-containing protein n=1 Tax=Falsibacillus pallidus TaxID=493781 RepID=A0A370GJZ7_9BACI|nr:hypothetical protein [Falsibacillus pallidus]RDI43991.1 hypothetical protein DFR59_10353 [Falsibacillus pallidus]
MDSKRKEIIMNEIDFWKKNNMLPSHYCDFLLALYSEGNQSAPMNEEGSHRGFKKKTAWKQAVFYLFLLIILAASVFVIYFTELSILLQTAILTFFVVLLFVSGIYYINKGKSRLLIFAAAAVEILLATVDIVSEIFHNDPYWLYTTLFLNCAGWLIAGKGLRNISFLVSGVLGVVILLISIFV